MQREKAIAALLPDELSQQIGHRIELYNEGMLSEHPRVVAQRFGEVLNAKPDMILWELAPYDLKAVSFFCDGCDSEKPPILDASADQAGTFARAWYRLKVDLASHGIISELCQRTGFSPDRDPVGIMLLHFLYGTQKEAIESYLMTPDEESGYLKEELSTVWQDRLQLFDTYVATIEQRTRSGSVPLVVTFIPNRAQAAMISRGEWPTGYNPYKLNN